MENHATTLISELRQLLRLTQTEAQIADVRQGQARTDAVRRELRQNADNAQKRTDEIAEAIRALGGVPDVLGAAIGRAAAVAKSSLEQAQTQSEALLGDLALEHQLHDRARYVKVLATTANQKKVVKLAERLEGAHAATIEWLTTVLAEIAVGGPAALRPTPSQAVVGAGVGLVSLPARTVNAQLNKSLVTLDDLRGQVGDRLGGVGDKLRLIRRGAEQVFSSGRDAALTRAEQVAREDGAQDTADALHEARERAGALTTQELPIKDYDTLNVQDTITAVKKLTKPEDVRAVIGYEEAHRNRSSVVSAAQVRIAELAKKLIDA